MLEVPAAGLAALRRSDADLERLRARLGPPPSEEPKELAEFARLFHETHAPDRRQRGSSRR